MSMRRTLHIAATLSFLLLCSSYAKESVSPDKEVVYKEIGQTELKLHIFNPVGHKLSDGRPAIIFFFGGGWKGGTPRQFYQQARSFADLGFVAVSADYRVSKRHNTTPFECVEDGKSAVRWIRQHAAEMGVDPDRIIAAGGSAGGHVAACTGVIQGHEGNGEDLSISSLPNAMILYNPVIDTTEKGYGIKKVGQDRKTEISPCHHVRRGIPPTLIFHGTADKTVPFENVERFTERMKDSGNICVLVPFEGKGHGAFNGSFFRPRNGDDDFNITMEKSIGFLTELGFINSPDKIDLFIIAGQSNAQGWKGDAAHYPVDPDRLDQQIKMFYLYPGKDEIHSSDGKWVELGPQGGRFKKGHFGPEITFARELKRNGYNPAIFKFSKGATSLAGAWQGPGDGKMYDRMTEEFGKALAILNQQGHRVNVRGFVWIQGESDSRNLEMANAYKARLKALVDDLRMNVTKQPELPVILGVDEQHKFVTQNPQVMHAQQSLAKDDENIVFTSMIGLEKADQTHLTPEGLEEHGRRIYAAYADMIEGQVVNMPDKK
jgi:acetyl esterase/lipase